MFKNTILATLTGAALLASGASFADNRHGDNRHGNQHRGHDSRRVVVQHYQPHYQHYQYVRPAPRYVVVQRPAPVYYQSYHGHNNGLAIIAGAVIGSAIGYHISHGY